MGNLNLISVQSWTYLERRSTFSNKMSRSKFTHIAGQVEGFCISYFAAFMCNISISKKGKQQYPTQDNDISTASVTNHYTGLG